MKKHESAGAEGPPNPDSATAAGLPRVAASESGVLPRMVARQPPRPSWDEVDEYLREGKHRREVERYAAGDPDFEEVLRWMRNELEAEEPDVDSTRTPAPVSNATPFSGALARRLSLVPPNR